MKTPPGKKQINLMLDVKDAQALKDAAAREDRSVKALILRALRAAGILK
jgi:hypothetical protein